MSAVELPLPRFTWPLDNLIELTDGHTDATSTDSDVTDTNIPNGSPEMSSTASDSPTPTNSVQERKWAALGDWQGLCEEQRQLLGTEEESSDRHSSEEDTEIASEVWTITQEQRDYYAQQFKQLQPDLHGYLAGNIARKFFEKSMLPVAELRKIWQLSDVTKDGMLNLEEFYTAMHLVVLRRNHICLPTVLPAQLNPAHLSTAADKPRPPSPQISAPLSPQTKETWTKFIDSPTSSPGPKPVNFDFQKASVETDPKILHPKALRLTPEILSNQAGEEIEDIRPIQRPQAKKLIGNHRGAIPPPPQHTPGGPGSAGPIGPPGIPGQPGLPGIPPEEGPVSLPAPKKDKPPPPPPRPIRSHGRSSSLDLNRLGKNGFLGAPPSIPPRVSPNISTPMKKLINQRSEGGDTFADFERFESAAPPPLAEKYENVSETAPADQVDAAPPVITPAAEPQIRRHGAFEVYRKPAVAAAALDSPIPAEDTAKYELYRKLKEQNLVLLRLCQELSQELADVREERTTLRLRLEQQQSAT